MRPPMASTLASLCCRDRRAVYRSLQTRSPDADHFVGGHLFALSAAAEDDAAIGAARGDDPAHLRADRRIVDRRLGERPAVLDLVTELLERGDQVLLERKARMVRSDRNAHGGRL